MHSTFITCRKNVTLVVTLSRHLSTMQKIKRHSVIPYYIQKCQRNPFVIQSFVRYQSTQNISTLETTVNSEKITEKGTIAASSNIPVVDTTNVNSVMESTLINNAIQDLPAPVPDTPTPIPEQVIEVLTNNVEPSLASLGLCNYTPVGFVQYCLEWLHVSCNLPWWASIAAGTVVIRLLVFPLIIKAQKNTAAMAVHLPEIQYLQMKMTEARKQGDLYEASSYGQELMRYTKENNVNVFKGFITPLIQAPIFISFFWALRQMVQVPVESMKEGGLLWFTDLTVYDPYYILPIVTSATLAVTIEIGTDSVSTNAISGPIRYVMRAMPIIIFPFTMHFEGAILCYWVSTNFISLIQTSILKIPSVREYFKITKPPIKNKTLEEAQKKGFVKGFKESVQNFKIARDLRERENFDMMQFRRAGKGPLIKTYNYNPNVEKEDKTDILTKKRSVN